MNKRHVVPKWLASAIALVLVFGMVVTSFPSQAAPIAGPGNSPATAPAFGPLNSIFGSITAAANYVQQVGSNVAAIPSNPLTVDISKQHPTNNASPAGVGHMTLAAFSPEGRTIDLNSLGKSAAPLKNEKDAAKVNDAINSGLALPSSGAVGTANAFLSISPEVVSPSISLAAATAASGFKPGEALGYYLNGTLGGVFAANANGQSALWLNSGAALGFVNIKIIGLSSGKVAGGTLQISSIGTKQRGLAIAPHAIDTSTTDPLLFVASSYTASQVLTISRNSTLIGTVPASTSGAVSFLYDPPAGPNGSAVYNSSVTGQPGSMAGQSVEERADAGAPLGPNGDRNISRSFATLALFNVAGSSFSMTGEGFQPGEVVTLTLLPGSPLGTTTANASGGIAFAITGGSGAGNFDFRLDGRNSGRQAWATFYAAAESTDVPTTIVAPSSRASGTITAAYTDYTPNSTGSLLIDGVAVISGTTNASGNGFVNFTVPASGLVHSVAFLDANGLISPGPLLISPNPPAILTGNITDATSGLPIKATVSVTDTTVVAQSDPQAGGVYTLTLNSPGTYLVTVTGSGCYISQTIPINIVAGTTTQNFALQRSGPDAGGYTCYDNAQRPFVTAANLAIAAGFDDQTVNIVSPAPLPFYGSTYFTGTISGNGWMSFGTTTASAAQGRNNLAIPNVTLPNSIAAVSWDDLQGVGAGNGVYTDTAVIGGNLNYIVEWRSYAHFNTTITNTAELQVDSVTGDIYMVYNTFNVGAGDGSQSTVGIENPTGTIGKQYQANTATAATQELNNYLWAGNSIRFQAGLPPTPTPTATATQTPTATATPCTVSQVLSESFTLGTLGTFTNTTTGAGYWSTVTTNTHSAPFAAFSPDVDNIADQRMTLVSPLNIPAGASAVLSFYHYYGFEFSGTSFYDGGVLEFSTDGGANWSTSVPSFISGGYNGTLNGGFGQPLGVRSAWVSTVPTYTQVVVNLSQYAGQSLLFRFRQGDDNSGSGLGWFVDDISVDLGLACATSTATSTPPAATFTATPIPATATSTSVPPTATSTSVPATATATETPGAATATATSIAPTDTPVSGTPTSTSTPAPCGGASGWSAGADLPIANARSFGAYYPPNGKFYVLGGRSDDTAGNELLNPLEYNPATNTWATKAATFNDNFVNNMAGGVLTDSVGTRIYVVAGAPYGATTATNQVRIYDPNTDAITVLGSDPFPANNGTVNVVGMGSAVYNNKLYILGGYDLNVSAVSDIWEFDPMAAAGSKWTHKTATLALPLAYVPAATVGNYIYTTGGATYDGTLHDDVASYRYDPATDTISAIADLPQATSNTRAVAHNGQAWVIGGGFDGPYTDVFGYDPATNTWAAEAPMSQVRRNFAAGTDGTRIFAAAGYADGNSSQLTTMEIYDPGNPCTPTVTPTAGAATETPTAAPPTVTSVPPTATSVVTATATSVVTATDTPGVPTATATSCPNPFVDINGNVFYTAIMYLYCNGAVNGIDATHYGPAGTSTRAQFAKVVVLGFAIGNYTPAIPTFNDVPANYFAYPYIEAGYHAGILSGFDANTCIAIGTQFPCYGPNRPITRAQLTKLVVAAGGFATFTPTSPTFSDVGTNNVFYASIETAHHYGIINGYPDGTFRPNNNIRRDEMAQIVYKGVITPPSAGNANLNSN